MSVSSSSGWEGDNDTSHAALNQEAESGSGGGDMSIWSTDKTTKVARLGNWTFTNNSSYNIPKGVNQTNEWSGTLSESEKNHDTSIEGSSAESGSGGGKMDVWTADRKTKIARLGGRTFINNTAFSVPKGINGTRKYNQSVAESESPHGVSTEGVSLAPNGQPLSGTVKLTTEDETLLGTTSAEGSFVASGKPFEGVESGSDIMGIPEVNASFQPKADGIKSTITDILYPEGDTLQASYGYLKGVVTDQTGSPVSGISVRAEGASTLTNETGNYALLAPGGISLTLTSLDGSLEKTATAQSQSTATLDWQYPGVDVTVFGPNQTPIEEAPVKVGDEIYKTNSVGNVSIPQLPLGEFQITIMEQFTANLEATTEGELVKYTYEGGSRLTLNVYDASTGRPVENVPAVDYTNNAASFSNKKGKLSLLSPAGNEFKVQVGVRDRRFIAQTIEKDIPQGESESVEVLLKPKPQVTKY